MRSGDVQSFQRQRIENELLEFFSVFKKLPLKKLLISFGFWLRLSFLLRRHEDSLSMVRLLLRRLVLWHLLNVDIKKKPIASNECNIFKFVLGFEPSL